MLGSFDIRQNLVCCFVANHVSLIGNDGRPSGRTDTDGDRSREAIIGSLVWWYEGREGRLHQCSGELKTFPDSHGDVDTRMP